MFLPPPEDHMAHSIFLTTEAASAGGRNRLGGGGFLLNILASNCFKHIYIYLSKYFYIYIYLSTLFYIPYIYIYRFIHMLVISS